MTHPHDKLISFTMSVKSWSLRNERSQLRQNYTSQSIFYLPSATFQSSVENRSIVATNLCFSLQGIYLVVMFRLPNCLNVKLSWRLHAQYFQERSNFLENSSGKNNLKLLKFHRQISAQSLIFNVVQVRKKRRKSIQSVDVLRLKRHIQSSSFRR